MKRRRECYQDEIKQITESQVMPENRKKKPECSQAQSKMRENRKPRKYKIVPEGKMKGEKLSVDLLRNWLNGTKQPESKCGTAQHTSVASVASKEVECGRKSECGQAEQSDADGTKCEPTQCGKENECDQAQQTRVAMWENEERSECGPAQPIKNECDHVQTKDLVSVYGKETECGPAQQTRAAPSVTDKTCETCHLAWPGCSDIPECGNEPESEPANMELERYSDFQLDCEVGCATETDVSCDMEIDKFDGFPNIMEYVWLKKRKRNGKYKYKPKVVAVASAPVCGKETECGPAQQKSALGQNESAQREECTIREKCHTEKARIGNWLPGSRNLPGSDNLSIKSNKKSTPKQKTKFRTKRKIGTNATGKFSRGKIDVGKNMKKITTYFETLDKKRVVLKGNPFKLSSNSVQDGCGGETVTVHREGVGVHGPVESSTNYEV